MKIQISGSSSAPAPAITGHTGLICLLGSPCAHSISPMMHNAAFRALGLDYCYLAFDVNEQALPDFPRPPGSSAPSTPWSMKTAASPAIIPTEPDICSR